MISKEKKKEYDRIYNEKHKESNKIKKSIYYNEHKEEYKEKYINDLENRQEKNRKYSKTNRVKINNHLRNKYKENNLFKISQVARTLISQSFRKNGFTKRSRSYQILGCSFENFKIYIENKFESWMTWENHGNWGGIPENINVSWDLDHVVPIASATTEEEIIQLNHYTNFQPLCSYINRYIKRDNIIQL